MVKQINHPQLADLVAYLSRVHEISLFWRKSPEFGLVWFMQVIACTTLPVSMKFPDLKESFSNYYLISIKCSVTVHNNKNKLTIPGGPKITEQSIFLGLCSDQQLSLFTLMDRTSFPHYSNTKIIKFGWKLFILWVISHGLSFSEFAINLSSCLEIQGNRANPENDSPSEIIHKTKSSQPNCMILVLI